LTPGAKGQCLVVKRVAGKKKNPGQQDWPGLMAGIKPMPSGFAKGEMNRLAVRWKQVIASGFYRDWVPGWHPKNSDN